MPALPRCDKHADSPRSTCSRCPACCALRGRTPSPRKPGTTGAERNRREGPLRDLRRGCAAAEDIRVEDLPEAQALLDAARRVVRRKMKEKT